MHEQKIKHKSVQHKISQNNVTTVECCRLSKELRMTMTAALHITVTDKVTPPTKTDIYMLFIF